MPRIYVASLSDYNAGRLHGRWIDLDGLEAEDIQAEVDVMLAQSPEAKASGQPAEEWAIHDFEGFEGLKVGEWESFERVARWAALIEDYGEAFALYVGHTGDEDADEDDFGDHYLGSFSSLADWAYEWAMDTTPDAERRKLMEDGTWPFNCIDWQAAGEYLEHSGDIFAIESGSDTYVFSAV